MDIFDKAMQDVSGFNDCTNLTEGNIVDVLKKFYLKIFERTDLHNGGIGGNIHIATINLQNNNKKMIEIEC